MFDSIHHHETRNVRVTEHRAPTDESVRLLSEFERAAEKKVIDSIVVQDNVLKGCILEWQRDVATAMTNYRAVFKFNGHRYDMQFQEDAMSTALDFNYAKQLLAQELAKHIAVQILLKMGK